MFFQSTIDNRQSKIRWPGNEEYPQTIQFYESRVASAIGSENRMKRVHGG
jgi:hypothetical protein